MPINPPALDDRSFDDLVDELVTRIPAHTPEWTNPRLGDPGRTMIELFAWLTETLLYRVNLIPERQRLAFLRLLGAQMRPATAARGLIGLQMADATMTGAISLQPFATVKGPAMFETLGEITVLPIAAEAYYKRPLDPSAQADPRLAGVIQGLKEMYGVSGTPVPYVTTQLFVNGAAEAAGFSVAQRTVDNCLWLALLAPRSDLVDAVRQTLGANRDGGQQLLNVGIMPAIDLPTGLDDVGPRTAVPVTWEMSTPRSSGQPPYVTLHVIADTTAGLTRRGIVRIALPSVAFIGAPSNDVRVAYNAGVGDAPPRLDVAEKAQRLVAWLRLRPLALPPTSVPASSTVIPLLNGFVQPNGRNSAAAPTVPTPASPPPSLNLSWIGVNTVEIDARQTIANRVIGQSDGSTEQIMQLPAQSVEAETLQIEVEEVGLGYQPWQQIDDLAFAGRDLAAYTVDTEAGTIRFGDGVRGRIPPLGRRIRVARLRFGGGASGNLPPGSLTALGNAVTLDGDLATGRFKVVQNLATDGGAEAESLAEAEQRIPALLRHADRVVTADDYRRIAGETPGVQVGRVETLPLFKPQQRRTGVPGVVSVMALPFRDLSDAPNPRPDRPFLEAVFGYLDLRRPLATELYVIGCEYVPIGVGVAVNILDGFGQDTVLTAVRTAIRRFLWPLLPGGIAGNGWELGRSVRDREIEAVVARVPGVDSVSGVSLFQPQAVGWQMLPATGMPLSVVLTLLPWQLPELLSVVAVAGDVPPSDLVAPTNPFAAQSGIAIPVIPKVC